MRAGSSVLGVNVSGATAFLALVHADGLVDHAVVRVDSVADLTRPGDVAQTRDAVRQRLEQIRPSLVAILKQEPNSDVSHQRASVEMLFLLCAADLGLDARYVSRATVRSQLGLPKSGKFGSLVAARFASAHGTYWNNRGPAALAALSLLEG